jgi:hypothetical protein
MARSCTGTVWTRAVATVTGGGDAGEAGGTGRVHPAMAARQSAIMLAERGRGPSMGWESPETKRWALAETGKSQAIR